MEPGGSNQLYSVRPAPGPRTTWSLVLQRGLLFDVGLKMAGCVIQL